MADTNLIRAGLPWSSPLKIIVDSSEVINDMTINRGLLNLLNNDYYLDLKTEAINHYIESNLAGHIADKSIHFTIDEVLSLLGAGLFLQSDATYKIPVLYASDDASKTYIPIGKINEFINKLPKHLNGHTLLLEFVFAKRNTTDTYTNVITDIICNSTPICINGFSNGTLLIRSTTDLNEAIVNPDVGSINNISTLKQSSEGLESKINQIVSNMINESTSELNTAFNFKGTGVNKYYSVFSLNDNTADIYLYNCKVTNTLSAFTTAAIEEAKKLNYTTDLPPASTIVATYLCNKNINPATTEKIFEVDKAHALGSFKNNSYLEIAGTTKYLSSYTDSINSILWQDINQSYKTGSTGNNNTTSPAYLTIGASTQKDVYIELRDYIYGQNTHSNTNFSIVMWIKTPPTTVGDIQYPIFTYNIPYSDKNPNLGLGIYLNGLYNYNGTEVDNNLQPYTANKTVSLKGDTTYFVTIDFLRQSVNNNNLGRSCYTSNWSSAYSTLNGYAGTNKMAINVTVYDTNIVNTKQNLTAGETVLIPRSNDPARDFALDQNMYFRTIPNILSDNADPAWTNCTFKFFTNKLYNNESAKYNWHYFVGKFRNIFFFNKILSAKEVYSFITQGIQSAYDFSEEASSYDLLQNISTSSYIGALSVYNSSKVSIIKNEFKTSLQQ